MVSVHSITRTKSFLNNLLRSLSLNVFTSVVIHAEFVCSEQTPFLCQNPHQSATHHVCIFSPGIFDSLEVHQAAPVPKNLISSADAKKQLCSIRGSTLFRTIAVVQWARNLGKTNTISSASPESWQNAEIVWLLQEWKSLRWKIQQRSFTAPHTYLADMSLDMSQQHCNTWEQQN